MGIIIDKTYELLDTLDESDLIINLTIYKNKLLKNKVLLKEIVDLKKETDTDAIIKKRKALFENNDYKMYMKYYNELSLIVLKINKKYKEYTSTKEHNCT